jgi:hypothetical protein
VSGSRTLADMDRGQLLYRFGFIGVLVGSVALVSGPFMGELGGMLAGYGSLVLLSAAYLLAGLAIRDRVRRRARTTMPVPAYSGQR